MSQSDFPHSGHTKYKQKLKEISLFPPLLVLLGIFGSAKTTQQITSKKETTAGEPGFGRRPRHIATLWELLRIMGLNMDLHPQRKKLISGLLGSPKKRRCTSLFVFLFFFWVAFKQFSFFGGAGGRRKGVF